MIDASRRPSGKPLSVPALLGLVLGAAGFAALAASGMGYRLGWWQLVPALRIAEWAAYAAALGILLSLAGLVLARPGGRRRGLTLAILGVVVSVPVVLSAVQWKLAEWRHPPINDISTDLEDAPVFWEMPNPTDYPGGETAVLQRDAYPGIAPLELPVPPARAYELALAQVRDEGWQIVAEEPEEGRIEAVDSSLLFGFEDEIAIRVAPAGGGSRVDLRSRSRLGRIDRGVNAQRIEAFLTALRARAGE